MAMAEKVVVVVSMEKRGSQLKLKQKGVSWGVEEKDLSDCVCSLELQEMTEWGVIHLCFGKGETIGRDAGKEMAVD